MHDVVLPLQLPFARHVLLFDPPRENPLLQLNVTTLRYVSPPPLFAPLLGATREPQVTTGAKTDHRSGQH